MPNLKTKLKLPAVALAAFLFTGLSLPSFAEVSISVGIAPPAIPVYVQPYCPVEGYIWTPGYWDYADSDYCWVPGVWVAPPRVGLLWTPGYWGFRGGGYFFNQGYWGPTVGFYGGINYGCGYGGRGYYGGEWAGNTFRYNTAVTRVDTTVIKNTYVNKTVVNNFTGSRAGFHGPNGSQAKPTAAEKAAATAEHVPPTSLQHSRAQAAKTNPDLRAANNHGKPKPVAVNAFNRTIGQRGSVASTGSSAAANTGAGAKKANAAAAQSAQDLSPKKKPFRDSTTVGPNSAKNQGAKNNAANDEGPARRVGPGAKHNAANDEGPARRMGPGAKHNPANDEGPARRMGPGAKHNAANDEGPARRMGPGAKHNAADAEGPARRMGPGAKYNAANDEGPARRLPRPPESAQRRPQATPAQSPQNLRGRAPAQTGQPDKKKKLPGETPEAVR